jgi:anti-sigma factor RsiW
MANSDDTTEPDRRTLADLSALADGTLAPEREPALREEIARSPELRQRYERERRAVEALHTLRADRAPAQVRLGIDARRRTVRRPRSRLIYVGSLATAMAAAVAALVLLLPGGTPGSPSVSQAAALALRGPAMAAPARHGSKLNQDVQEVYFPDWSRRHWHAVGQRIDQLGGRKAVTVFYEWHGKQVAYTILAMPALRWPGTTTLRVSGVKLQSFSDHGRQVVTWRRSGHTCLLSGTNVPTGELAALAASEG